MRGKGGIDVWVALNARTQRAVLAAAAQRTGGPIVRRPADRRRTVGSVASLRPYNRQAIYERLLELGSAAGEIDKLHRHLLRHSFVTLLLDAGVPLAAVQDAARHTPAPKPHGCMTAPETPSQNTRPTPWTSGSNPAR
ncbi:MAG: site-specific integrase [Actinobacteria bacterium]|nr:site-specific integrase [Actinomycetota bacterium]